jgi:pyrimidine-nucleoside phosphorylase
MGKKLAAGASTIVLDVKCGSGAFVKNHGDARILAENMVKIGNMSKRRTAAIITNMDIPLGYSVGNILEVKEAIATLRGEGPADLTEICIALAALMAHLSLGISLDDARENAKTALSSGAAFKKFREWMKRQGADTSFIDNPELFGKAEYSHELRATRGGYISKMDAEAIGLLAMELGAGRKTKDDAIDYSAGIVMAKKTGDKVCEGDLLATLYTEDAERITEAERLFGSLLTYSDSETDGKKLIYEIIT